MGKALYRKYRSLNLDEVLGQEHITGTLRKGIKAGRISHAYLFTGPRGVGKTSVARILAYDINGLPYDETGSNLDIIEIDAASNRRIDEIRDIRDKVYIAPANAKYKVYIIDEVHMLTKEAFNALLKTLEEPPEHVVFILATTEAHKLPATIVSRTQRYTFRPIPKQIVIDHLKTIAKTEAIDIEDAALGLIAEHGEGSFRDSISLLDQAGNSQGRVTIETIQSMLGIAPNEGLQALLQLIATGSKADIIKQLDAFYLAGFGAAALARQLAAEIRQQLVGGNPLIPDTMALDILTDLIEVPASANPEQYLEIALLRNTITMTGSATMTVEGHVTTPTRTQSTVTPPVKTTASVVEPPKPKLQEQPPTSDDQPVTTDSFDLKDWPAVFKAVKVKYNTLSSILGKAEVAAPDGQLVIKVAFPFHQKRLNENKNKALVCAVIKEVTGKNVSFTTELSVKKPTSSPTPKKPSPDTVENVSNIFGGGEVLS